MSKARTWVIDINDHKDICNLFPKYYTLYSEYVKGNVIEMQIVVRGQQFHNCGRYFYVLYYYGHSLAVECLEADFPKSQMLDF